MRRRSAATNDISTEAVFGFGSAGVPPEGAIGQAGRKHPRSAESFGIGARLDFNDVATKTISKNEGRLYTF
jgi:hypothetical protein